MKNIFDKKTIAGIIIIIIVAWFMMSGNSSNTTTDTGTPVATTTTTTTVKPGATTVKKSTVPLASQPVSLSYQQALEQYKGSYRIQLSGDAFCQANPNTVMFKNGTSIMIDNRSSLTRTIKLGATSYTLSGYGFKIIKLSSSTLPTVLIMDCGSQQNIAKITLQA